jgi:Ca-activated chloride channel family protein
LHRSLERLNEGDSFNIMAFRDQSVLCFPEWQQVSPASLARARWFIENMRASGRTDVYASLKKALETPVPAGGVGTLILVTDGRPTMGVVDSSDIIEQFSGRNDGRYSVFAVGGGRRVNRYLLDLISFRNRGDSLVVRERKDIPDALVDWSEEVRRPVLTDFHFQFSGVDEAMIYPQALTHLYLGRPLDFYGKCPESIDSLTFQLVGNHGAERYDMIFEVNFNQAMQGDASLREGWAWHRIYYLIGEHIRTRDPVVNQQIEQVAKEYDLVVPYGRKYPLP